jgi:tRNA (uracil-5-)-methyltransferase
MPDNLRYQQQLETKLQQLPEPLAALPIAPTVYTSAPSGFRMRAEFRIWHEGERCFYSMFDPETKAPVEVLEFPIAHPTITRVMPALLAEINQSRTLRHKLFQVEFLTTQTQQTLVTLIYHKRLDDHWKACAKGLETQLGVHLIGRSRKQKITLSQDWVWETLHVGEETLHYKQPDGAFTQPNSGVNQHMLAWAKAQTEGLGGDLLELYCGVGNFTMALAPNFRRVLATEMSKPATAAALDNAAANNLRNIAFARLSAEEMSQALEGVRPFRRLAALEPPLAEHQFSTLFVDPPRAGLDPQTLALAARFEYIVYISCNPTTLAENVATLRATHTVTAFAVFDQFPYTPHLECGLMLKRTP